MGFSSKHSIITTTSPIPAASFIMVMMLIVVVVFLFIPQVASLPTLARLLQSHGLPAGIFPENASSFTVDCYGRLRIELESPCYAEYENLVYFSKVVEANLSYGQLLGLEGLQQKELFLWLPVKNIIVDDPNSGVVMIDIGVAHEEVALSLLDKPPVCTPAAGHAKMRVEQRIRASMQMITLLIIVVLLLRVFANCIL